MSEDDPNEEEVKALYQKIAELEAELAINVDFVKQYQVEVKRLREALQNIIKHHDTMMNGDLHTATWHIAKQALGRDE